MKNKFKGQLFIVESEIDYLKTRKNLYENLLINEYDEEQILIYESKIAFIDDYICRLNVFIEDIKARLIK